MVSDALIQSPPSHAKQAGRALHRDPDSAALLDRAVEAEGGFAALVTVAEAAGSSGFVALDLLTERG